MLIPFQLLCMQLCDLCVEICVRDYQAQVVCQFCACMSPVFYLSVLCCYAEMMSIGLNYFLLLRMTLCMAGFGTILWLDTLFSALKLTFGKCDLTPSTPTSRLPHYRLHTKIAARLQTFWVDISWLCDSWSAAICVGWQHSGLDLSGSDLAESTNDKIGQILVVR